MGQKVRSVGMRALGSQLAQLTSPRDYPDHHQLFRLLWPTQAGTYQDPASFLLWHPPGTRSPAPSRCTSSEAVSPDTQLQSPDMLPPTWSFALPTRSATLLQAHNPACHAANSPSGLLNPAHIFVDGLHGPSFGPPCSLFCLLAHPD